MTGIHSTLVPPDIQRELEQGARSESKWLWLVADRALFVYNEYKKKKDAGVPLYRRINDVDVYKAVGHYARKSPSRIGQLKDIAAAFSPEIRGMIEERYGEWEFGYYERAMKLEKPLEGFEFLAGCLSGELVFPGRKVSISDFEVMYNTHVLGKQCVDMLPEDGSVDLSKVKPEGSSFQDILHYIRKLKNILQPHQSDPDVRQALELAEQLEIHLPYVMQLISEIVMQNSVDKKKEIMYS